MQQVKSAKLKIFKAVLPRFLSNARGTTVVCVAIRGRGIIDLHAAGVTTLISSRGQRDRINTGSKQHKFMTIKAGLPRSLIVVVRVTTVASVAIHVRASVTAVISLLEQTKSYHTRCNQHKFKIIKAALPCIPSSLLGIISSRAVMFHTTLI